VNVTAPVVNQAPIAALIVSPTSGMAALNVAASTSGSSDPDGSIASTRIDFGDGTVATTMAAAHVYGKVGTYTVRATVTDNQGASVTTSKSVVVTAGVKITSPAAGASPTSPVRITASAAALKAITSIRVYVDSMTKYAVAGSVVDTTLTMSRGTHIVVVQAWDTAGAVYKSSVTITVR
jgi:PKD repeat protein